MAGDLLLDTNIVAALFENDPAVTGRLTDRSRVYLSATVLGELYFGALKSKRPSENLRRIHDLLSGVALVECDAEVALAYGTIKDELRLKGRPIPDNDVWIAAAARCYGLSLVSRE
jgi:tRNA(fMet)-specific endonuclease VapC